MTSFAFGKTIYSENQEYSNEPTYKNFLFNRVASTLDSTQERLDYRNQECSDCPELSIGRELPDGETECEIVYIWPSGSPVPSPTPSSSAPAPSPSSSSPAVTPTPSSSSGGSTPTPSTSGTTPTPTPSGSTPTPSVST